MPPSARAAVALFALVGACRAARVAREPVAEPAFAVALWPRAAEVWSWETDLHGEVLGSRDVSCLLDDDGKARSIAVSGDRFSARVELTPGTNVLRLRCTDSAGRTAESAPARLIAMLRDGPTARLHATAVGAREVELDARASSPSGGSKAPIVRFAFSVDPGSAASVLADGPRARVVVREGEPEVDVQVEAFDAAGERDLARAHILVRDSKMRVIDSRSDGGPRTDTAVVYGVYPPLFGSPPLEAVTRSLPELAELGVDTLWLAPIFSVPGDDYGYAVRDYFRVREDYGSERDLSALVTEAHRLGLRVLLDLVPNHTSSEHPYFVDAEALGTRSAYYPFYQRDAQGEPTHYFDWEHLPNLNYDHAQVVNFMLAASGYWVNRFDVDGYRIDVAWGIRERTPAFWSLFRAEMRRLEPTAFLIAEGSARDPFYAAQGFDAAYDWTEQVGSWAWADVFSERGAIAERLRKAVGQGRPDTLRFLENNDTGARFVTRHGPELTRVAAAALFTVPGIPCLFTGQERGASYEPYAAPPPLTRADPHGLRPWYQRLVALRRSLSALETHASYTPLEVGDRRVLAFVREHEATGERALVILGFTPERTRAELALSAWGEPGLRLRDTLTNRTFAAVNGMLSVMLEPWSAHILVPVSNRKGVESP